MSSKKVAATARQFVDIRILDGPHDHDAIHPLTFHGHSNIGADIQFVLDAHRDDGGFSGFHFAKLDERHRIFKITFEPRQRIEPLFQIGAFAHDFLRGIRIIPKIRVFDLRV